MFFIIYQKKIKSLNEISEIILESQLEICLNECSLSDVDKNTCVKDCFFKGHDYSMRAFEQYLNKQLTIIENKINKLCDEQLAAIFKLWGSFIEYNGH